MPELPAASRLFALLGSLLGFLSVALGAFGAHALRARLDARDLEIFEIGVRYQMYHALALLLVAMALARFDLPSLRMAGWAFLLGALLFSGTLHLVVLGGLRWMGAVTPFGGVILLAGWALLGWSALQAR